MKILDRMLRTQQFTPSTAEEYIALQLAKRLKDEPAIKLYLHYASHHPVNHLLRVFRKARGAADAAQEFHSLVTSPDS